MRDLASIPGPRILRRWHQPPRHRIVAQWYLRERSELCETHAVNDMSMTRGRYAIESRFFAPSTYRTSKSPLLFRHRGGAVGPDDRDKIHTAIPSGHF